MDCIDIEGAGFVVGVPGIYANCRVYVQEGKVQHVGPLYQEWPLPVEALPEPELTPTPEPTPVPPVAEPQAEPTAEPIEPSPPVHLSFGG